MKMLLWVLGTTLFPPKKVLSIKISQSTSNAQRVKRTKMAAAALSLGFMVVVVAARGRRGKEKTRTSALKTLCHFAVDAHALLIDYERNDKLKRDLRLAHKVARVVTHGCWI